MMVVVICRFVLCGKSSVNYDGIDPAGYWELEFICRERTLIGFDTAAGNASDIRRTLVVSGDA